MDERAALSLLADRLPHAGDDAAVVDGQVLTTDMLHETTDFPAGTTRYTAGWRSVGASLSDVAAMGAEATAAVAIYAAPEFDGEDLEAFVAGASDVCEAVGAEYVGGDLDESREFTAATTALGRTDDPVRRSGARPGERVCVTGTLGRTGAALRLFERSDGDRGTDERDDGERANDLFRFEPRVAAGRAIAPHATAMMDSSDGLARSLHQLAEASDCGFAVEWDALPVDEAVREVADSEGEVRELSVFFGEDFELVFTVPECDLAAVRDASPTPISVVGDVTETGVEMDGEELADRGYTHGEE
ncbi:thiamine-phosphate kinase [Halorussus salinisoli]|uniref:thiamine-phosphate kinase n=1 Tax=Halorussus salinisoli TaxID=2558242 RepID=UPI0010C1C9A9|nr:thiamine-phosphate kinase [Halorussus salinisoli]